MLEKDFIDYINNYFGDQSDRLSQIKNINFSGEDLFEFTDKVVKSELKKELGNIIDKPIQKDKFEIIEIIISIT